MFVNKPSNLIFKRHLSNKHKTKLYRGKGNVCFRGWLLEGKLSDYQKSIGRSLDVLFPCNLENYIDERKRQYDIERKVKI